MSALHDGQHYLVQDYQVVVTPGLQLIDVKLLILSACRTAVGDKRAVLGLSGMAVISGNLLS